jgi:hypothetical protein
MATGQFKVEMMLEERGDEKVCKVSELMQSTLYSNTQSSFILWKAVCGQQIIWLSKITVIDSHIISQC